MKRALLWPLWVACACSGGPERRADPGNDLAVQATLEGHQAEGEIGRFRVRIRNGTPSYVVLCHLAPAGSESFAATWQVSLAGRTEYQTGADTFLYERNSRESTAPVFNRGLLAPGEEISFGLRLRLLDLPRITLLRYYRYDLAEVSRRVYFEKRADKEVRYLRLFGRDLEERLVPSPARDVPGHRVVIFPYAEQVVDRPSELRVEIGGTVRKREFSLEQARAKAGLATDDEHTYYDELGLWALRSGDRAWLVGAQRLIELPRTRNILGIFYLLDSSDHPKVEIEFLKETKTLFADELPLIADARGRRFFAFLPRTDLLAFFEKVRSLGLIVDAEVRADGGGRLKVTR